MSPTRIAVIGAGLIGRKHIAVLRAGRPDYTLAGVADMAPSAQAEAAARRTAYLAAQRGTTPAVPSTGKTGKTGEDSEDGG